MTVSGNERSGAELAPAVSKAVVATAYGGPEVLSMIDVIVPDPGPGQVRIAVRAAGVNPVDHKMYSGAFGTRPGGSADAARRRSPRACPGSRPVA